MPSGHYPRKPHSQETKDKISLTRKGKYTKVFDWEALHEVMEDGCWGWKGKRNKGNGSCATVCYKGKRISPAKLFYLKYRGEVSKGSAVVKTCKNALCVNPAHLKLVSNNKKVRYSKQATLSPTKVKLIKEIHYSGDKNQTEIAELFGVDQSTISLILRNKIWKK